MQQKEDLEAAQQLSEYHRAVFMTKKDKARQQNAA